MTIPKFTGLALAALLVAGCGGGSSNRVDELETELEETQTALDEATAAAAAAAKAAQEAAAEAQKAKADLAEAEQKRQEDVAEAQQEAEQEAQQAQQEAAAAAQRAAEAEKAQEAAEERLSQSELERQFTGFGTSAGTLSVKPKNGEAAIIGTPDIATRTFSAGGARPSWDMTTGSANDGTYRDSVAIYSDVDGPTSVEFQDSEYNAGKRVVNAKGVIIGSVSIRGARTDIGGTGFPATSAPPQTFELEDRGFDTQVQRDAAETRCAGDSACIAALPAVRDKTAFKLRYSVDVDTANLSGATGKFRCESSSATTACTVQRRGTEQLFFVGPWAFTPTAADTTVMVDDAHFMWFGWWAREHLRTKEWSYAVGHGPVGSRVSSVAAVSGNATYSGSAIGRFAIDDPLDDEDVVGSFTATAALSADFDANTLSGSIHTFVGAPDQGTDPWTVHLRKGSISGGNATGTVGWSIGAGDNSDEGGSWSASFYSNLPANQRTGVVPYGVAGTFTAEHSGAANIIGAFGAHKQ